jgi:hypothetical protein
LQYSKINELPTADPFNVNTLHNKLRKPQSENRDCHIAGDGSDSWGNLGEPLSEKNLREQFIHFLQSLTIFWAEKPKKPFHHLVVPGKKRDVDGLTRWITSQWIPFWDAVRKYITAINDPPEDDPEGQITDKKDDEIRPSSVSSAPTLVKQISRAFIRRRSSTSTEASTDDAPKKAKKELITYGIRRIRSFTTFVTTIVACLLPTAAIAILATMHSTAEVLGFIGLFTALFAGGLMCLTDPTTSRTEIFTATAAYVFKHFTEHSYCEEAKEFPGSPRFWLCLCRIRMVHLVALMGDNKADSGGYFLSHGLSLSSHDERNFQVYVL